MSSKLGKKAQRKLGIIEESVKESTPHTTTPKTPRGVMINLDQATQSGQVPHNSLLSMYHGRGTDRDYSNVYVRLLVATHLVTHVLSADEASEEIRTAIRVGSRAMQDILAANKTRPENAPASWIVAPDQYHEIEAALDVMDQLQRQVTRKELEYVADEVLKSLIGISAERKKMPADALVNDIFKNK